MASFNLNRFEKTLKLYIFRAPFFEGDKKLIRILTKEITNLKTNFQHLLEVQRIDNSKSDDLRFPLTDWIYEVSNGDTKLGYDEWVQHQIEAERKF